MTQQRTPITEVVGDSPATAEDISTMSVDEQHEVARVMWATLWPTVGAGPTTQATRTLADLMGPG